MKRFVIAFITCLMALTWSTSATAQNTRELTRQERKALQAQIDSMQFAEALQAVNDTMFTLEANRVVFKYGQTAYVTSNTNFVSVHKGKAVVQVAFNVPFMGLNGLGGVTVQGRVNKYVKREDKNTVYVDMDVFGTGISAHVTVQLYKGGNEASVDITPNLNSNRLTLKGNLLPTAKSNVFRGEVL